MLVAIEEEPVKPAVEVVVMGDVVARPRARIELLQAPEQVAQQPRRQRPIRNRDPLLPEQDRQLLLLKEVEGFSVQELAEILGLNVNTVKVRLFRARGRIMEAQRRRSGAGGFRRGTSAKERKP